VVRRLQSLRQKDVAKLLGVDTFTIINWENGRTEPEARHIPKILELLGEDYRPEERTIWTKLKRFREGLGMSQEKFASLVGVNETTMWRWEQGAGIIPKRVLKMMEEPIVFHAPKTKIGLAQLKSLRTEWEGEG
jgi:DNA-binding XRE family transcriptional regulator